jgi:hypothetical protein
MSTFKRNISLSFFFYSFLIVTHATPFQALFGVPRGGASSSSTTRINKNQAFDLLARVVQGEFEDCGKDKITKALLRLASSQQTLKNIDGMAHEAYQRTHSDDIDTSVAGRAQRSAARIAATAEALLACELVELIQMPQLLQNGNDTFAEKQVLLNITENTVMLGKASHLKVLVLFEPSYDRGAGLDHGSIASLAKDGSSPFRGSPRGRLLVVLGDSVSENLMGTLEILKQPPKRIKLSAGLVNNEVASVQPEIYKSAGQLLEVLEPHLRKYNTSAVHFVGRSLAGGVASLAATMLDGTIPLPKKKKKKKSSSENNISMMDNDDSLSKDNETLTQENKELKVEPLNGLGRARSSAISLGAPPCLSSNVVAAFCTSFIYGDDIVSRTTSESLDHLIGRLQKSLSGGFIGKNLGFMTDTFSLTVSSLKSHAHGSEGEEIKLAIPGRAFLLRPRRLGGLCSIHEVGNLKKGGREALRANLLWQLHDILLSKSMWKHHGLESYILGLDRVHLRSNTESDLL